jgi:hypothetical protein
MPRLSVPFRDKVRACCLLWGGGVPEREQKRPRRLSVGAFLALAAWEGRFERGAEQEFL